MACKTEGNIIEEAIAVLSQEGLGGMSDIMTLLLNEAMKVERARHLQAAPYERVDDRNGYANGFKPKQMKTRIGILDLQVPQVRESESGFYPSILERGLRSERALKCAIAEMYLQGVATRRVKSILRELCNCEVSSTQVSRVTKLLDEELQQWRARAIGPMDYVILDARYEKVRRNGAVVDNAVLIAHGIDPEGKRHVLGVSVSLSEQELHWRGFLESLTERGLHGVKLIISDAHSGLKAAKQAVFPSVPWQRCQFHLQQNAQSHVPKKSMKKEIAATIRAIFNAPNRIEADRLLAMAVKQYESTAADLTRWMEVAIPEGLTVFDFPIEYQKKLRTSNLAERTNKEIKRRTRVVGIFPNVDACERLVTALLIEMHDEWQLGNRYLPPIQQN